MKKLHALILIMVFTLTGLTVSAQNNKFGHINSQVVLVLMPEYKKALDSLQKINAKYAAQEEALQVEFNRKYNDLLENQADLDSLIVQSKVSELENMQSNLQQFQQLATDKLNKLQGELLNGVMNKLNSTVKEIAIQLDLTYVFDTSNRNPMYTSEKSIDLTPMVKEKLGL